MSKLKSNAQAITYTINRFRGVNESADSATATKTGEASYMRNYRITDSGALAVRYGVKDMAMPPQSSGAIRAMWGGMVGDEKALLFLRGGTIYMKYEDGIINISGLTVSGSDNVHMFFFSEKLYILTGNKYYCVSGGTVSEVEGYIPTVVIAAAPNGNGTLYEQINKLTAKRKVRYSADGSSTDYFLPEKGRAKVMSVKIDGEEKTNGTDYTFRAKGWLGSTAPYIRFAAAPEAGTNNIEVLYKACEARTFAYQVASGATTINLQGNIGDDDVVTEIVAVARKNSTGGTDTLNEGTDYTVNASQTAITLATAQQAQTEYYVQIEFEKHFRKEVCAMTKSEIYNGSQDTRLFIYGDGGNVALYSGLDENGKGTAEYFPDLNEIEIGDTNTPITAMIRHRNRLLAFKPEAAYSIYYSATSLENGNLIAGFYLNAINKEIGSADGANAVSMENRVRTLCHNSIYEWKSTNSSGNITSDARNAETVSERVRDTVKSFDMSKCIQLYDDINKEYYCFNGDKAVVNNTVADAWYIYDSLVSTSSDKITAAAIYDGKVYMGTQSGAIRYFDKAAACDDPNSEKIAAEWHSHWLDFGRPHCRKYSPKLWVSGICAVQNGNGNITVRVEADDSTADPAHNIYFQRKVGTHDTNRVLSKIKNFLYYKLKIKTYETEAHATITGAVIIANYTIPQRH